MAAGELVPLHSYESCAFHHPSLFPHLFALLLIIHSLTHLCMHLFTHSFSHVLIHLLLTPSLAGSLRHIPSLGFQKCQRPQVQVSPTPGPPCLSGPEGSCSQTFGNHYKPPCLRLRCRTAPTESKEFWLSSLAEGAPKGGEEREGMRESLSLLSSQHTWEEF